MTLAFIVIMFESFQSDNHLMKNIFYMSRQINIRLVNHELLCFIMILVITHAQTTIRFIDAENNLNNHRQTEENTKSKYL